ncbi:hypothetical protein HKD37_20G055958 [Glycine soja]
MSPSPLGSHNHSQTHLKLSERLPLRIPVSADLHTAKSLRTLWNLDLSLSRTFVHAELLKKSAQTPFANLILGLNSGLTEVVRLANLTTHLLLDSSLRLATKGCA